jgi:SAM-dependent methyltransferase
VLQALALGARAVDVVEIDAAVVDLVRHRFGEFAGGLYSDPRVRVIVGDSRRRLRTPGPAYDLIVVPPADSVGGAGAGVAAAADSFLLTLEALAEMHDRLAPEGLIVATRWLKEPPRDALKLFATAAEMLRREGATAPGQQLALIRGWQTSTLLIRQGPLRADEVSAIARFAEAEGFDPAWHPDLDPARVNRFNRVATPWLAYGARALQGSNAPHFLAHYKFDLEPASDDRPFFHDFFRWRTLPELWRLREHGGAALLDSGYLVMLASVIQALPVAVILILLPLIRLRREGIGVSRWRPAAYFLCLGLAFLFVEIAMLSRYSLLIGHPLHAAAVVLATLLVGAGCGSAWAARLVARPSAQRMALWALVVVLLIGEVVLPAMLSVAATWSLPARVVLAVGLLAPPAILMGMPFPLGLSRLAAAAPRLVPWAWGINGCASVLSALLALLLAVDFGYRAVVVAAAILYALAALVWVAPGPTPRSDAGSGIAPDNRSSA